MLREKNRSSVVKPSILILSTILLNSVVAMAYGFFQNNLQITYLGLSITIATSFTILIQTILPQNDLKRVKKS